MLLDKHEEEIVSELEESEEEYDDNDEKESEDATQEEREPYNDQAGLQSKLNQMKLNLEWIETLDITIDTKNLKLQNAVENDATSKGKGIKDDFKREMLFYSQAQEAVKEALGKLQVLHIPTERPEDYFAEMVKSDVHMQKVRRKLLEKKDGIELSEKARKQRELKKIGKKIQQNVLQKRQVEKKKMLNEVDRMKKGKSQKLYGHGGDSFDVSTDVKSQIGKKRKMKDEKFGFGGRKRKLKKNSIDSSAEMSSYKSHIHGKARNDPMGKGSRKTRGKTVNHNKAKKRGKR